MRRKQVTYLAGPIEFSKDGGASWRKELTPFLQSLHIKVFDPVLLEAKKLKNKRPNRLPKVLTTIFGEKRQPKMWHHLKDSQERHLLSRFLDYMQVIIKKDLHYVRRSDFVIAYWEAPSFGTAGELTIAFDSGMPVYMVTQTELPAWVRGCCTRVFTNFDDLKRYLVTQFGPKA